MPRARIVLGMSALAHDPAVALIADGRLIAAVEQERLNREKRTTAFPSDAVAYVLDEAGIELHDVDRIGYYWNDRGCLLEALCSAARQAPANPAGFARLARQLVRGAHVPTTLRANLRPLLGRDREVPPIEFVDHHRAHLTAAWLSAPFQPDAAIVMDGRGEVHSTALFDLSAGPRQPPRLLETYDFPNSLGVFYGGVTQQLGYQALSDEYKVMGLASYGGPSDSWCERIRALFRVEDDRPRLQVSAVRPEHCWSGSLPWFTDAARERLSGHFRDGDQFTQDAFDLAWAAQNALEEAVLGLLRRVVRLTGGNRVVLVGGVAMNAAAVGRARAAGIVEDLHVPLAPTDAGASVGAALEVLRVAGAPVPSPEQLVNPFQGPGYCAQAIETALRARNLPVRRCDAPAEAARAVAAGRLVGWFDGRMEFGERALGARSILGDPRSADTRDRINASVKRRESYRPFAPSVLEEYATRYFDTGHSRRMGEIVPVTAAARAEAPAVVHVDGTARPQTVPVDWPAQPFRQLLERLHELTGVPMVVNTSFNVRDEPIVCSPQDALQCFAGSGLDHLFIGGFVLDKADLRG